MIKIKLANLAQKLNKSISDIARETDINRNTITSLYHNKLDGIKFSTLEKLCEFYDLDIGDILEYTDDNNTHTKTEHLYRQEAIAVPFTGWTWMLASNNFNTTYFEKDYGEIDAYFKGSNGQCFYYKEKMYELAQSVYKKYKYKEDVDRLYDEYSMTTKTIVDIYDTSSYQRQMTMTIREVLQILNTLLKAYAEFWAMCYFIDSFDSGFDEQVINEISKKYTFDKKEIAVLTSPTKLGYSDTRLLALLHIIAKKKITKENIKQLLELKEIQEYINTYDYYKGNYVHINKIKKSELKKEILYYSEDPDILKKKMHELQSFEQQKQNKKQVILKKHKLKINPLYFFSKLTDWREDRKRVNMMGVYVLLNILKRIEDETGIDSKYLKFISPEEIESILSGLLTEPELRTRYKNGMLVSVRKNGIKIIKGAQATSVKNELEEKLHRKSDSIIRGQTASQGYAKGIARIIVSEKDFTKFKKNEILITSMTSPEFTPLIKIASAIVTNEGGITCHAAVITRENHKPCIIATGNATELISTGDLIEVRANHGTVRILQKKKIIDNV
ncbi:MAG: PEP-utilizing enzyme [Patescibacteria group bacterium]|nr:PEP-utilizing enzyme [Patescibacteria group bacterium]